MMSSDPFSIDVKSMAVGKLLGNAYPINTSAAITRMGLYYDRSVPLAFKDAAQDNPVIWIVGAGGVGCTYFSRSIQREAVSYGRKSIEFTSHPYPDIRISDTESEIRFIGQGELPKSGQLDMDTAVYLMNPGYDFTTIAYEVPYASGIFEFWLAVFATLTNHPPENTLVTINLRDGHVDSVRFDCIRKAASALAKNNSRLLINTQVFLDQKLAVGDTLFLGRSTGPLPDLGLDSHDMNTLNESCPELQVGEFFRAKLNGISKLKVPLDALKDWEPAIGMEAWMFRERLAKLLAAENYPEVALSPEAADRVIAQASGYSSWNEQFNSPIENGWMTIKDMLKPSEAHETALATLHEVSKFVTTHKIKKYRSKSENVGQNKQFLNNGCKWGKC